MSSERDGIFVTYRVIFITVLVSICTNLFFLAMGILIGNDDLKWVEQDTAVSEREISERDPVKTTDIDRELSNFEPSVSRTEPSQAIKDPEPVIDTPIPKKEQRQNRVVNEGPVDSPPVGETVKPESPKPASSEVASSKPGRTRPAEIAPPPAGAFWVQVLASKDRRQAESFRGKVAGKGYRGVILQEDGFYKVLVGPYENRASADKDRLGIDRTFSVKSWVRTR